MSANHPPPIAATSSRTPDEVLDELKLMLESLPTKGRAELLSKIHHRFPQPLGLTLSPLTMKTLEIPENTAFDVNRLAPCVSALIEFLVKMDDTAWGIWKGFGSESKTLKREIQMRPLLKALLRGNSKLTARQVEYQIANLMRVTVEMLGQLTKVGLYASQYLRKFHPKKIRAEVDAQRSALSLTSADSACWDLYTEKWEQGIEPGFQRAVNKEITKTVAVMVKIQRLPV